MRRAAHDAAGALKRAAGRKAAVLAGAVTGRKRMESFLEPFVFISSHLWPKAVATVVVVESMVSEPRLVLTCRCSVRCGSGWSESE